MSKVGGGWRFLVVTVMMAVEAAVCDGGGGQAWVGSCGGRQLWVCSCSGGVICYALQTVQCCKFSSDTSAMVSTPY